MDSVLLKNTTQCPWPGIKPGSLDAESNAVTRRPPRLQNPLKLHWDKQCLLVYKRLITLSIDSCNTFCMSRISRNCHGRYRPWAKGAPPPLRAPPLDPPLNCTLGFRGFCFQLICWPLLIFICFFYFQHVKKEFQDERQLFGIILCRVCETM